MNFFSPAAIKLGAWSPSKAAVLDECALKFHWQYMDKPVISNEDIVKPDTSALDVGSATHKYAELLSTGMPKQEALAEAKSGYDLTSKSVAKVDSLTQSIDTLQVRLEALKQKGCVWDKCELKLSVDKDLRSVSFFSKDSALRGVIDRAIMMQSDSGSKHIVAIDIKTGKPGSVEDYMLQLESYGILLHSAYPEAASIQPCLYFTESNSVVWHPRKIYKRDICEDNPAFIEINRIADLYSTPANKTTGIHCNWCVYKKLCDKRG